MTRWLGSWDLIPELSHYSSGGPPDAGRYVIAAEGDDLTFAVAWTAAGQRHEIAFRAPADGTPVAAPFPGVDTMALGAESDRVLTSVAMTGGTIVSRAVRRVSADGNLMSVLQENGPDVAKQVVFQLYRRHRGA